MVHTSSKRPSLKLPPAPPGASERAQHTDTEESEREDGWSEKEVSAWEKEDDRSASDDADSATSSCEKRKRPPQCRVSSSSSKEPSGLYQDSSRRKNAKRGRCAESSSTSCPEGKLAGTDPRTTALVDPQDTQSEVA
jgi:hypothetical protein